MSEILNSISNGSKSLNNVVDDLAKRPFTQGSEVIALISLAKDFGFLEGNENELILKKEGLQFMNYIQNISESTQSTEAFKLSDVLNEISDELPEKKFQNILQKISEAISRYKDSIHDFESFETFVTVTLPPRKIIPLELKGIVIFNEEAEKRVIADCKKTLYIASPYIEPSILQMLLHQSRTSRAECIIITSDEDRLKKNSYLLKKIYTIIRNNFSSGKILYLKSDDIISHAKLWLSEQSVLITSANILPNSQTNNFELGIYTNDNVIVNACKRLVEKVIPLCQELKC